MSDRIFKLVRMLEDEAYYCHHFANAPLRVPMPIASSSTSQLPRSLETFAAPYGIKRSHKVRLAVRLHLLNGGEEHSFRLLYQSRLRRLMRNSPGDFKTSQPGVEDDPASRELLKLKAYAHGVPLTTDEERVARQSIENYCLQLWMVDEIVRRMDLREPPNQECWYRSVTPAQHIDGAKRCEFMDETWAPAQCNADEALIRRLERDLRAKLKTFAATPEFTKPIRYLARCIGRQQLTNLRNVCYCGVLAEVVVEEAQISKEMYDKRREREDARCKEEVPGSKKTNQKLQKEPSAARKARQSRAVISSPNCSSTQPTQLQVPRSIFYFGHGPRGNGD